jgi:hypothetical protein
MATEVQSREEDDDKEETGLGCTHQHQHPASTTFGISSRPIEGPREAAKARRTGWVDGRTDGLTRGQTSSARPDWGSGRAKARQGKAR